MTSWYFSSSEIVNTPSRSDNIDMAAECRYRREGARFIMDVGTRMNLRYETVATGIVFFHRFFMIYSFKTTNRLVGATACLFLAGKAEETPKKCKDLVKAVRTVLSERQMEPFGEDPKEEIINHERLLLQTIKFDLCVQHPYKYIVKYAKNLKGDRQQIEKIVQMAWNFVNDRYSLNAASEGKRHDQSKSWWQHFLPDIDIDVLEDICLQMVDFYDKSDIGASNYNVISPPKITMKDWENIRKQKNAAKSAAQVENATKAKESVSAPLSNVSSPSTRSPSINQPSASALSTPPIQSSVPTTSMLYDGSHTVPVPPSAEIASAVPPPPSSMIIPTANQSMANVLPNASMSVMPQAAAPGLSITFNQNMIPSGVPHNMALPPPINNVTEVHPGVGIMPGASRNSIRNWNNMTHVAAFPAQPSSSTGLPVNLAQPPPSMNSNVRPTNPNSFSNWMS